MTQDALKGYPLFLSTLSLRRATPLDQLTEQQVQISIHALLAESDCCAWCNNRTSCQFLSTLSLRRATRKVPLLGIK